MDEQTRREWLAGGDGGRRSGRHDGLRGGGREGPSRQPASRSPSCSTPPRFRAKSCRLWRKSSWRPRPATRPSSRDGDGSIRQRRRQLERTRQALRDRGLTVEDASPSPNGSWTTRRAARRAWKSAGESWIWCNRLAASGWRPRRSAPRTRPICPCSRPRSATGILRCRREIGDHADRGILGASRSRSAG